MTKIAYQDGLEAVSGVEIGREAQQLIGQEQSSVNTFAQNLFSITFYAERSTINVKRGRCRYHHRNWLKNA
jgi:hypothetical protein